MSHADVRAHAARVSDLLVEVWTDDFPESFPEIGLDDSLGLALAHAVRRGWIEPDPAMSPCLNGAEALLGTGHFDE